MADIQHVSDQSFESDVLNSEVPVLVDYWAEWCGPCKVIAPVLEEIADEYDGQAVIGKLDVDANRETAVKYGIQAIPTLLLVKDGEIADRIVGAVDKNSIKTKLSALL